MNNAADFVALTETNFEVLTSEVFKHERTYVSGVPTTTVGPPTTGSHVLDEVWKDALGGCWRCTAAGTPGTWRQILPAVVTLGNVDGEIGGLAISDPLTQAEVQALRDKAEELADDVRSLSTLIHALRTALVAEGLIKGGA